MDAPLHGLTPDDIQFAGEVDAALARRPRFGVRALSVTVAVMFACLLVWAAFAKIDEVTHAEGQVVGSQRTQTIQNLEGGILRAVLVREGQIVDKGDVLAQLDNELAESSYRDAVNKAMENSLAIARLEAELKNQRPAFPENLQDWAAKLIGHKVDENTLARARQIIRDQENAWQSRQNQLNAEIEVLKSQYEQRQHDVEEQIARKTQLDRSLALSIEQRDTAYALVQRNNFSRMEYLGLQQKVVELQGQIDMLAASIPKAQAAAEESKQRIASRRAEQNAAITEEINKRRLELNSLRETLAAGSDRVTRTELRTPVRGTVKQIYINTVGGVVKPGEPIMDIVPLDDTLLVEAKVSPKDVAFLRPGQEVMVKVSAYDFSIYGGLEGKLESISADTIEDKKGNYHYLVKVRTQKTAITYHNEVLPIIPGMIVTADILIGKKTVLDYLLKPILKAKQNALRER
ncbi:hemolysin secretion protein D [Desulfovibrio fairfieldensis]|uniref:Hemolysin secretion protein D n=2 Tax=Desulfovibrio fairfieldensis TaxID=44742 RepID=A0A0X8JMQ1_9BACT|nr:hemolysin secretion protein D [Desulfovibrio fairfieldensis]